MSTPRPPGIAPAQHLISVLWPSFIIATIATGIFFAAFDPRNLVPFNLDIELSPLAFYSIGFFVFWLLALLSSIGTLYFTLTNARFLDRRDR